MCIRDRQYPVRMFSVESASVADHKCAYPYARNVSGLFYLLKCLFQAFRKPFARFQPVAYGGAVSYIQLKIPDFFAACQLGKAFQVFFQLYSDVYKRQLRRSIPSLPPQVWAFRTRNRTFRYYPRPRSCSSSFPPQAYSQACTPALRPAKAVRKPPAGGSSVPFQIAALH